MFLRPSQPDIDVSECLIGAGVVNTPNHVWYRPNTGPANRVVAALTTVITVWNRVYALARRVSSFCSMVLTNKSMSAVFTT